MEQQLSEPGQVVEKDTSPLTLLALEAQRQYAEADGDPAELGLALGLTNELLSYVSPDIHRTVRFYLGTAAGFEDDVCQIVFEKMFKALEKGKFRGESPFEAWTNAIAKNASWDYLAKRSRINEVELPPPVNEVPDTVDVAQTAIDGLGARQKMKQVLDHLSPSDRRLLLEVAMGVTLAVIAKNLGIRSVKAAKMRVSRARRKAREALDTLDAIDEIDEE